MAESKPGSSGDWLQNMEKSVTYALKIVEIKTEVSFCNSLSKSTIVCI